MIINKKIQLGDMIKRADLSDWNSLFISSTKWFDAIIRLKQVKESRTKPKEMESFCWTIHIKDWKQGHYIRLCIEIEWVL